jgi:hypothetical protein
MKNNQRGEAMAGFLYVVSADNLRLTKIGFTKNYRSRLKQLGSNSASAHPWHPWRVFRCDDESVARKLERRVMNDAVLADFKMPGKSEFFACRPTVVTDVVKSIAESERIGLFAMPWEPKGFENAASFFPGLPEEILSTLDETERMLYWRGVRDVLRVLSMLPGVSVTNEDFATLHANFKINHEFGGIEVWQTIVGHFRNGSGPDRRSSGEAGFKHISRLRIEAIKEWQSEMD